MGSRKRSARQRQVQAFREELASSDLGGAFERERERADELDERRDSARRIRACESKNRYVSRQDAEEAIARSAEHGRYGLHCYRCPYCHGWHLTSHPRK